MSYLSLVLFSIFVSLAVINARSIKNNDAIHESSSEDIERFPEVEEILAKELNAEGDESANHVKHVNLTKRSISSWNRNRRTTTSTESPTTAMTETTEPPTTGEPWTTTSTPFTSTAPSSSPPPRPEPPTTPKPGPGPQPGPTPELVLVGKRVVTIEEYEAKP